MTLWRCKCVLRINEFPFVLLKVFCLSLISNFFYTNPNAVLSLNIRHTISRAFKFTFTYSIVYYNARESKKLNFKNYDSYD